MLIENLGMGGGGPSRVPRRWDEVDVSRLCMRGLGGAPATVSLPLALKARILGKRITLNINVGVASGNPVTAAATARAKGGSLEGGTSR